MRIIINIISDVVLNDVYFLGLTILKIQLHIMLIGNRLQQQKADEFVVCFFNGDHHVIIAIRLKLPQIHLTLLEKEFYDLMMPLLTCQMSQQDWFLTHPLETLF